MYKEANVLPQPVYKHAIQAPSNLSDSKIRDDVSNNLYYVGDIESESKCLRRFHNYIKYQYSKLLKIQSILEN